MSRDGRSGPVLGVLAQEIKLTFVSCRHFQGYALQTLEIHALGITTCETSVSSFYIVFKYLVRWSPGHEHEEELETHLWHHVTPPPGRPKIDPRVFATGARTREGSS